MASTTKIMTAFIVVRLMAKDPRVGDEMVTFSRRADRTVGSSAERPRGRAAARARAALWAAPAVGQRRGRRVRGALRRPLEAARRRTQDGRPAPPVHRRDEPRGRRAGPARDALRQPQRPAGAGASLERPRPGQAGPPRPGRARLRRGRLDPEARLHAGRRPRASGATSSGRTPITCSTSKGTTASRPGRPRPPAPASSPAAVAAGTT